MLPQATLEGLTTTPESQFVERKVSCPNGAELRKTLTAFANSTPERQYSVVLIGIENDGTLRGIDSPDSVQKSIKQAADECYPPITISLQIFACRGVQLLAIIVPFSSKKPHFTGRSYVRVGSISKEASDSAFENLIASRNSKAGRLLAYRGIEIEAVFKPTNGDLLVPEPLDRSGVVTEDGMSYFMRIESCDSWILELRTRQDIPVHVPLEDVKISWSSSRNMLKIFVAAP